jgi:predicted signal transduction protein with EAL and GGDEF domain
LASARQAWLNGDVQELECRIIAAQSGQEKTLLVAGTPTAMPNDTAGSVLLSLADISEQKRSAAMIKQLSHHDTLTGLPNRTLFLDRLQQARRRPNGAGNTTPC